ncbi:MAG: hypothetical protein ABFD08_08100 [Syntrophomonas sp.]
MDRRENNRESTTTPKRVDAGGPDLSSLSAYQTVVYYYLQLTKAYHWTPEQIDAIELDMFWDLLIVNAIVDDAEENPQGYIDQVLF